MRSHLLALAIATLSGACAGRGEARVDAELADAGAPIDAAPTDSALDDDADAATPVAHVRFAALATGAALCLASDVVDFASDPPKARALVGAISTYVDTPQENAFVRAAAFDAPTCARSLGPIFGGPVLASSGGYFTVVLRGDVSGAPAAPLDLAVLDDDASAATVRIAHEASRAGLLVIGSGSLAAGDFATLAPMLAYGDAVRVSPSAGALSVHAAGETSDRAVWTGQPLRRGATIFLADDPTLGSARVVATLCEGDGTVDASCARLP